MVTESNNSDPLVIACDLIKDQRLYCLPSWVNARIEDTFAGSVKLISFDANNSTPEAEAEIDVYWGNFFTADLLERMPKLKWIHCASVGVNRAAVPEVAQRNIVVTNSHGILTAPVSAAVMGMICALARGFHHAWRLRSEGRMDRLQFDQYFDEMHDLEGETCLIVGLGDVGSRVAATCAALGMKVSAIKNRIGELPPNVERVYPLQELVEAVRHADYVVNLLPLTVQTQNVFNDEVFAAMKATAFFINTGRGPTVGEPALIRALEQHKIAGAGLDVFNIEPLPQASALWNMPQTILMPHVACLSVNYWPKQISLLEENIRLFRAGKKLVNTIDFNLGY